VGLKVTPIQALALWRLLVAGGEGHVKDLKPEIGAPVRKQLQALGLVEITKRRQANGRQANYFVVLDQGWRWAQEFLDHKLPPGSTTAIFVLREVMIRIRRQATPADFSLAEFFSTPAPPAEDSTRLLPVQLHNPEPDLRRRIIAACQHLAAGVHSGRIRLADLRSSLEDVSREQVDETLRELEMDHSIVAYPLDNPREINLRDEEAALRGSGNNPRHVVYLTVSD
jgi:DNA-binding PadR family transcriptional regulator